MTNNRQMDARF